MRIVGGCIRPTAIADRAYTEKFSCPSEIFNLADTTPEDHRGVYCHQLARALGVALYVASTARRSATLGDRSPRNVITDVRFSRHQPSLDGRFLARSRRLLDFRHTRHQLQARHNSLHR